MTGDKTHRCAIDLCPRQIPTTMPVCEGHREQISGQKGGRAMLEKIDQQFNRRRQGLHGAALRYQEAVSAATAALYDSSPAKAKK